MQRITTATRAVNLFGAGKDGFKNGDLSLGDAPTDLNAAWFNGTQEELMNVIEGAGLAPNGGDLTQLLQALRILTGGPGRVEAFARSTAPAGWLKCGGQAVSRTTYAALFAAIGTTYGVGDGSTTFNLPDLRGEFVRGLDDGRGVDTGRGLGTGQAGQNAAHTHGVNEAPHAHSGTTSQGGSHSHSLDTQRVNAADVSPAAGALHSGTGIASGTNISAAGNHDHTFTTNGASTGISVQSSGGTEARPRNVALLYCISIF